VFVVVHDVPFQKGVAQSIPSCNNPVAHVFHIGPIAHGAPSWPSAHVAHIGPIGHCGPTHHAAHIIVFPINSSTHTS
jgi:hypothetical protein